MFLWVLVCVFACERRICPSASSNACPHRIRRSRPQLLTLPRACMPSSRFLRVLEEALPPRTHGALITELHKDAAEVGLAEDKGDGAGKKKRRKHIHVPVLHPTRQRASVIVKSIAAAHARQVRAETTPDESGSPVTSPPAKRQAVDSGNGDGPVPTPVKIAAPSSPRVGQEQIGNSGSAAAAAHSAGADTTAEGSASSSAAPVREQQEIDICGPSVTVAHSTGGDATESSACPSASAASQDGTGDTGGCATAAVGDETGGGASTTAGDTQAGSTTAGGADSVAPVGDGAATAGYSDPLLDLAPSGPSELSYDAALLAEEEFNEFHRLEWLEYERRTQTEADAAQGANGGLGAGQVEDADEDSSATASLSGASSEVQVNIAPMPYRSAWKYLTSPGRSSKQLSIEEPLFLPGTTMHSIFELMGIGGAKGAGVGQNEKNTRLIESMPELADDDSETISYDEYVLRIHKDHRWLLPLVDRRNYDRVRSTVMACRRGLGIKPPKHDLDEDDAFRVETSLKVGHAMCCAALDIPCDKGGYSGPPLAVGCGYLAAKRRWEKFSIFNKGASAIVACGMVNSQPGKPSRAVAGCNYARECNREPGGDRFQPSLKPVIKNTMAAGASDAGKSRMITEGFAMGQESCGPLRPLQRMDTGGSWVMTPIVEQVQRLQAQGKDETDITLYYQEDSSGWLEQHMESLKIHVESHRAHLSSGASLAHSPAI